MKILLPLLVIILTGCNNVINQEGENETRDSIPQDTVSNEGKLNDIINQNRDAEDSIKNIENIEPHLKNPK